MNINDLEHIAIRSPKYVAGTTKQPKIDLFVQTHKKYYPIKESNMSAGQTVWMKWSGGPIVANAKLLIVYNLPVFLADGFGVMLVNPLNVVPTLFVLDVHQS